MGPFTSLTATVTGPQGNENHKVINTVKIVHRGVPSDAVVYVATKAVVVANKGVYSCEYAGLLRAVDCKLVANDDAIPGAVFDAGSTGAFIYVVGVYKAGQQEFNEKKGNKEK